jgi:hypothetical protein
MIPVPTSAVPSQTFSIVVANQDCQIALRQNGANMYFDLIVSGSPVVTARVVRNKQRLLLDAQYHDFVGDFIFNDTQGDTQPFYTGLGVRYQLFYMEAADLP